MPGNALKLQSDAEDVVAQSIEAAADLVRFRTDMRRFLSGVHEDVVAEAILVAVMLAGDAVRDGAEAVQLRLRRLADRRRLRLEMTYLQPQALRLPPHGYRARILDQLSDARGISRDGDLTTIWFEFALIPKSRTHTERSS